MKKLLFKLALVAITTTLAIHSSQAQWVQNPTLEGGNVNDLLVTSSGALLAATGGGVFRSTDNGTTWDFSSKGLGYPSSGLGIYDLLRIGNTIFATAYSPLSRSTDDGMTWENLSEGDQYFFYDYSVFSNILFALSISPGQDGDTIKLYKSIDDGGTFLVSGWALVDGQYGNGDLYAVGSALYVVYSDDNGDSLFMTSDGISLTGVNMAGLPAGSRLRYLTDAGGSLILVASDQKESSIYKFNGVSWILSSTGIPPGNYEAWLNRVDNALVVSSIDTATNAISLYSSVNNGDSWSKMNTTGLKINAAYKLMPVNGGKWAALGLDGLYISSDQGTSWSTANKGLLATNHGGSFFSSNNELFTLDHYFGILRSQDKGETYSYSNNGLPTQFAYLSSLIKTDDDLWVFYRPIFSTIKNLYHSSDNGSSWSKVNLPVSSRNLQFQGSNGSAIFLQDYDFSTSTESNYRSVDHGATWQPVTVPEGFSVSQFTGDGTVLYIEGSGPSNIRLYKSIDNGNTWAVDTAGLGAGPYYYGDLFYDGGSKLYYATVKSSSMVYSIELYIRGTDKWKKLEANGLSWDKYPQCWGVFGYNNAIYLLIGNITSGIDIYSSIDQGKNFTKYNDGFYEGVQVQKLAFIENKAFAATSGNGIWKNVALLAGVNEVSKESLSLSQNYPNPASGFTTIEFELIKQEYVRIDFYDINGAWVKQALTETLPPGRHIITLDLKDIAAGVYSYRLNTSVSSVSKKMVVLK